MQKPDQFLLGIFGPNCSSGMSVTKIPERWDNSWENNVKLAQMLDDAGIEFILPVVSNLVHRFYTYPLMIVSSRLAGSDMVARRISKATV